MANPNPLEKDIEKKVCDYAKGQGCLVYKFTSPSKRSVPDRLFIMPGGRGVFFIEFKRLGQKPTPAQAVEIDKIRKKGVSVFVVDNVAQGKACVVQQLGPYKCENFSGSRLQKLDANEASRNLDDY